jgi:hypothetical protein
VVDLVRADFFQGMPQSHAIGQVAIMEKQVCLMVMRITIEMIETIGVKRARPSNNPMDFVPFGEQKLCQIGAVLPGNPRNERPSRRSLGLSRPIDTTHRQVNRVNNASLLLQRTPSA